MALRPTGNIWLRLNQIAAEALSYLEDALVFNHLSIEEYQD